MTPNETKEDNLKAFNQLLDEKEHSDKVDKSRYRYFEDLRNNMYKWTTHPQDDNKFHAWILKARHSKGWLRYTTTKTRYFVKRKTAKAWCLKYYLKAQEHHKEVLARQEKRKADLEALKPQLTPKQKSLKRTEEKIAHFEKLSKKTQTKIKAHTTRLNNYQKKVKYYQRKLLATVSS